MTTSTADRLMQMASEADVQAEDYIARYQAISMSLEFRLVGPTGDQLRAEHSACMERAAFHRGQASGFRQSAYYAALLEGTHAYD
jgi:hypothetical protein